MGSTRLENRQSAILHGGDLARARARFPLAPEPWIDLSTGINPHSYPHSPLPASAFSRLPEPAAVSALKAIAANAFGASSPAHLVAAPGTQMLMPLLAGAALEHGARRAAVLAPTYAEHARTARLAGLPITEVTAFADLFAYDYAVVVNPNNPDGRVVGRADLIALAVHMKEKGGFLVIDEAFIETGDAESLADATDLESLIVLRSFGKFYGMAGLRLGFAIAHPGIAETLETKLGPWAISGPALHVAREALSDEDWRNTTRIQLRMAASRLDRLLNKVGLAVIGGTSLFRLVRDDQASRISNHLGHHGILVRTFEERPNVMRFGLPGTEAEWSRLEAALESTKESTSRLAPADKKP